MALDMNFSSEPSPTQTSMASSMALVQMESVGLQYPTYRALRNLTFSIAPGTFHFLTGLSGSGKTSMMRMLARQLLPTEGKIYVFGKDIEKIKGTDLSKFRQNLGIISKHVMLLDHLTLRDNVALPLKIAGQSVLEARQKAEEMLIWVGMEEVMQEFPSTISEGEQQRVRLARAAITRPLLILADDPTDGMDDAGSIQMIRWLEDMNQVGSTVIMATHHMGLVADFPYPELRLQSGHLIANDSDALGASRGSYGL